MFTAALVQGLRTGAADTDHDGHVSVDDAYAYVFDQVQAAGAAQTPQRWLYGAEGQILLARNPAGPTIIPAPLPDSLRAGLDSPHPAIRVGAVTELGEWLTGGDPARAATARRHLQEIADTDIPRVAHTARALLDTGTTAEPPTAKRQSREIMALQSQLRSMFTREEFQAVVGIADRLIKLDPAAADPDGMTTQARQRLQQPAAEASARPAPDIPPAPVASPRPHVRSPVDTGTAQAPRLAYILTGHTRRWGFRSVHSVAFSPDSRLLASGCGDKAVRLWDPATGECRRTLTGHTDGVLGVAFSPDGQLLASGSFDGSVRLWDPVTGECRRTLTGHTDSVWGVAFSPDGQLLASGGGDRAVKLWDPASGECRRTLTGPDPIVRRVAFSPDGRLLASVSGQTVWLWDPATGECRRTLTGHTDIVLGVAFSPDGQLLASGSFDGSVRLWDPATGEHRRALTDHTRYVREVTFSPDGRLLASGSTDKTVKLWDPASGECRRTLTGHTKQVSAVAFSPDGRLLASGGVDKTVRLWDLSPGGQAADRGLRVTCPRRAAWTLTELIQILGRSGRGRATIIPIDAPLSPRPELSEVTARYL